MTCTNKVSSPEIEITVKHSSGFGTHSINMCFLVAIFETKN